MRIIAEKINGTRKAVAKAIAERDAAFIQNLAQKQAAAGASWMDVNAGTHPDREPDPAERREAAMRRALDRAEMLYGRLDAAQRRLLGDSLEASPFDPEAWLAERQRRQRDTLQTLRLLVAERADRDRVVATLRALTERTERSPDPAYRAYQEQLRNYNCAFAARVHAAMTPAQRQTARENLQGWEDDLRSLRAPVPSTAP